MPNVWYYTQSLPWYYVAGYVLFLSNWVYAIFGAPQSICAPLWTVAIEEQFYLIWPVVARMLTRRGMMIAGIVTFLIFGCEPSRYRPDWFQRRLRLFR